MAARPATSVADRQPLPLVPALEVLRDWRTDQVVFSSMGTSREWPKLSRHPRDFHYQPSTMGGVTPLGLGLALALPKQDVIVMTGDGSLLMNLGTLATVAAAGAANLSIIVLDNGVYEVTGGQATAGEAAQVDFAAIAAGCGINSTATFRTLAEWRAGIDAAFRQPGPRCIVLRVAAVTVDYRMPLPEPLVEQTRRLRRGLGMGG